MTNSELFTAAHKLAKTFEGNYTACFVLALREVRSNKNSIELIKQELELADTASLNGRNMIVKACKELYNTIESPLYKKYGEMAINDAYNDLCNGDFSEPFTCFKKKEKFRFYYTILKAKLSA